MRGIAGRILLALGSVVFTVLVLEVAVRLVDDGMLPSSKSGRGAYDGVPDPLLGYGLRPSSQFRARKQLAGKPCYEVVYTVDALGRRVVGTPPDAATTRPRLVLFGCSYTFGEGLDDADTLAFHLGRRFEVINYAVHGYGPQQTLALLRSDRLERQLPPGEALGLYVLHGFHFERAVMSSDNFWLFDSPHFELADDGSLRQFASFSIAHPIRVRLYRALHSLKDRSPLVRRSGVRWPPGPDPSRASLTAAILVASARRFEEQWKGPFVIAVEGSRRDPEATRSFLEQMRAAKVAVIDDSSLENEPSQTVCPGDGHPNGHYNAALAERLEHKLLDLVEPVPSP